MTKKERANPALFKPAVKNASLKGGQWKWVRTEQTHEDAIADGRNDEKKDGQKWAKVACSNDEGQ